MSATNPHFATPSSLPSSAAAALHHHMGGEEHDAPLQPEEQEGATRYGAIAIPGTAPVMSSPSLTVAASEREALLPKVPPIPEEHLSRRAMIWEELVVLGRYTLPVFGSHVLEYSLVVASVVSIGHISTTALAASTLASMTAGVTGLSIMFGLCSALDTLLPAAWTSGHPQLVGLWSQRMLVIVFCTLLPIIALWFNAEKILLKLRQEPEVAQLAALYLRWFSLGLPAYGFNAVARRYFQAQGHFSIPTRIIMVVAPLNALLNYLLVWHTPLGFKGAPLATATSFNLISALYVVYALRLPDKSAWHPLGIGAFSRLGMPFRLGLSGVAQIGSEWWSWELAGLAASMLGPVALATQSILLVSASTTYQAPFAIAVACSVRIGNLLGEGNARRAHAASDVSLLVSLAVGAFWSTMFILLRSHWAALFNDDPTVAVLVARILPLVALFQIFDGAAGVASGVLRARGRQGTGALINLTAYYVLGLPLGAWLTFRAEWGLVGLWAGLTFSLVYASTLGCGMVLTTDWEEEVRRTSGRVESERRERAGDV